MWTHTHTTRYQKIDKSQVNALTCNVGQALVLWATTQQKTVQTALGSAIPIVSGNALAYMPFPTEKVHFAVGFPFALYEKN